MNRCMAFECLEGRHLLAAGPMSAGEQHFNELINWVRAHPAEAAQRYGAGLNDGLSPGTITADPKPPLARNTQLRDAISGHVADLLKTNTFSHTGSNGSTLSQRLSAAGYTSFLSAGENLAWWGVSGGSLPDLREVADNLVEVLFKSPSHRQALMNPGYLEVGSAIVTGPYTQNNVTYNAGIGGENFGKRAGDVFLTGVGCRTRRTDVAICDVTTAISGAALTATRVSDQLQKQTTTSSTGGYDLQLPNGTWSLHIEGGGLPEPIDVSGVTISGQNVKWDFQPVVSTRWKNPVNALDVDKDRRVAPIDVLVILNELNANGAHALPYVATPPTYYLDTNGDNYVSPADALAVINHLNAVGSGEGENSRARSPLAESPGSRVLTPGLPNSLPVDQLSAGWESMAFHAAAVDAICAGHGDLPRLMDLDDDVFGWEIAPL
jgi:hypothetical protein